MRAIVFRHTTVDGLGTIEPVLERAGFSYQYIDAHSADFSGLDPLTADLLIVLGGTPGVYQKDDYPFFKEEMKQIEARLAQDLPVLGICLGAQMMAHVLGSRVYPGEQGSERGWFPLRVNEEGMKTPVRHLDGEHTHMACWHGDTFDFPAGAKLLASSDLYENQIFTYGKNALGLQCHAEATPRILMDWFVGSAGRVYNKEINLPELRAQTEKHSGSLMAQTEKFLLEWLEQRDWKR